MGKGKKNAEPKFMPPKGDGDVTLRVVNGQTRATVQADGFEALVALFVGDKVVWIRSDFSG